ncbi:MAG TPA: hypothetical protein VHT75_00205 [Acidimicrobiales bacterium]|jgi:hypothetical protein|nr:hypothetical protein [Acidimicrobiales bacterium]
MSANLLRLVPTDPAWVPDDLQQARGIKAIRRVCPIAEEISAATTEDIRFVDAGSNFETVRCPGCRTEITYSEWQTGMDEALKSAFNSLDLELPCCGCWTTLNDLEYEWPQGFARWVLTAASPGRLELSDDELSVIAEAVGHDLRQIWAHY